MRLLKLLAEGLQRIRVRRDVNITSGSRILELRLPTVG